MKFPAGYVPGEGVYKATAYGGFGERLLKKMGWEEGSGLGINERGLKKAIEVKQKEDQSGVCYLPPFSILCVCQAYQTMRFSSIPASVYRWVAKQALDGKISGGKRSTRASSRSCRCSYLFP